MSSRDELLAIARDAAAVHELEFALVCAVIEQESGWDTWAVRYEKDFFSRYIWPLFKEGKIDATEAHTRSMSYGLMQVMGQVAREFGFTGKYLTELCDPHMGVEYGCRKLSRCLIEHNGGAADALLAYNGGADAEYPLEVLARVKEYAV